MTAPQTKGQFASKVDPDIQASIDRLGNAMLRYLEAEDDILLRMHPGHPDNIKRRRSA